MTAPTQQQASAIPEDIMKAAEETAPDYLTGLDRLRLHVNDPTTFDICFDDVESAIAEIDAILATRASDIQAEREKCAKIADNYECSLVEYAGGLSAQTFYEGGVNDASVGIAAAIRKGGE